MLKCVLTLLALMACGQVTGTSILSNILSLDTTVDLSQDDIDFILKLHNEARARVNVAPLTYDVTLQGVAEAWARKCNFNHDLDSDYNDNLAAAKPPIITNNTKFIDAAVTAFINERDYHDSEDNWDCMMRNWQHKTCAHYTQIVWGETERVGCSIIHCSQPARAANLLVCVYDPPGNYEGEEPY
jgi:pathogenesis-related protein 1